jgi:hypothetical protein
LYPVDEEVPGVIKSLFFNGRSLFLLRFPTFFMLTEIENKPITFAEKATERSRNLGFKNLAAGAAIARG